MRQPTLFDKPGGQGVGDVEQVVLYALGDFQNRGKVLAERELALDRLRGALRRASAKFRAEELSDEVAIATLESLGATVRKLPSYIAKHPYRVIVPAQLATRANQTFQQSQHLAADNSAVS